MKKEVSKIRKKTNGLEKLSRTICPKNYRKIHKINDLKVRKTSFEDQNGLKIEKIQVSDLNVKQRWMAGGAFWKKKLTDN